MRELCSQHKFRYGYRKITALLRMERKINHKRVQRIMQREGLQCRVKVKKRKPTGQPAYIPEHLLKRQCSHTDITYLPFGEKTLYLSSILDLFNLWRKLFLTSKTPGLSWTRWINCLLYQAPCSIAIRAESTHLSPIKKAVKGKGITMSISRKGTPADNALIELFHSTLKSETFYFEGLTCTTTAIVKQTVRDYNTYYNSIRIQAKLNVAASFPATGCLNLHSVLIPVSQTGTVASILSFLLVQHFLITRLLMASPLKQRSRPLGTVK
ncbi:IS3 family transposase [Paenibacillus lautus]|uniref:IS3 family transposase n=1 Tax=Paenibacillus lautus TaxID=1401 RepID=UPI0034607096